MYESSGLSAKPPSPAAADHGVPSLATSIVEEDEEEEAQSLHEEVRKEMHEEPDEQQPESLTKNADNVKISSAIHDSIVSYQPPVSDDSGGTSTVSSTSPVQ